MRERIDILALFLFASVAIVLVITYSFVILFYFGILPLLSQQKLDESWRKPLIVAHNGGGDSFPEDTLEAIQIAVEKYHVDIIEVDVHLTRDKRLVCIHDSSINRTTNGTGEVSSFTLEEISRFDASFTYPEYRNKGIKIPSIEQVIDYILPLSNVKMFIEIKPPASKEIITSVQQLFAKYDLYERAMVISFEPHTLYKLRKLDEKISTSLIVAGWLISAGCSHHILPQNYCDVLHSFGIVHFLDWAVLKLSTSIIPWSIGVSGIVIASNSTSPLEVKKLIAGGYFVDIWGIKDEYIMKQFWNVGATIAPDTLVNLRE